MIPTSSCMRPTLASLFRNCLKGSLEVSQQFILIRLVNNLRMRLDRMAVALEELAVKGPMKPEALRGLEDLD